MKRHAVFSQRLRVSAVESVSFGSVTTNVNNEKTLMKTTMAGWSLLLIVASDLVAQSPAAKPVYPTPPRSLGESEEIALAMTAAPEEISSKADVYVLRGTDFVKARPGTNGCSCMVGRDLHDGSRYPICFDQEGTRSTLLRELK